ncbi:MAG TPA: aminotransferase class I/II-fold pyridoxal phosphate-dependent enzyme [Balneolaceae bacterium]|nr:aminotransferase class I/II-fold pyridoxal phosphate-dependent enzyme [Balneolaceae bacterium]
MNHSSYISWAKKQHNIKYNLASSGMPGPILEDLVKNPKKILEPIDHENGWAPLMRSIADRYEVNPDQVIPVHSASFANHLVCALFLNPGDVALVENPAYEPLVSLPKYFNASVKQFDRNAEKGYQPDPQQIEKLITDKTKLIILTNLHNPSGILIDETVLWQIIDIASTHDCYILIDEVYLEFLYPNGERTAAKYSDHILTTRSLTKAFGLDDLRVGWIIAESILAERIRKLQDLFMTSMAAPSERLGLLMLGKADEMLEQNLSQLKYNFRLVEDFIDSQASLSWHKPRFGSVGFVKYSSGNVDMLASYLAEKYDTIVAPGHFFGAPDHFRIGWGLPTEKLEQGLENLGKVI